MSRKQGHYRGRPLPRPGEEVVDQGLSFDVDTLLGRRAMLRALGFGTAGVALAACAGNSATAPASPTAASAVPSEIPDETAGPFPGDGSNGPDVLEHSGIIRSDIRSSFGDSTGTAEGVPMTLELTITDLGDGGKPFEGAAVYVWHCDRAGGYSLYSQGIEDQNYLRGVQIVDNAGKVSFRSIFPACYAGRWPHIHFEVYPDQAAITDAANAVATSQVALPNQIADTVYRQTGYEQSVTNLARISLATDNVFGDDGGAGQLATVKGDVGNGYLVSLDVGIDTTTSPARDGAPGGPPPGGPGGAPPPRP